MMNSPIRFAGLTLSWSKEYASSFAKYLKEIGYCTRIIENNGSAIIAYAYRDFSTEEMINAMALLFEKTKELAGD